MPLRFNEKEKRYLRKREEWRHMLHDDLEFGGGNDFLEEGKISKYIIKLKNSNSIHLK